MRLVKITTFNEHNPVETADCYINPEHVQAIVEQEQTEDNPRVITRLFFAEPTGAVPVQMPVGQVKNLLLGKDDTDS
jgi:hypothetical protein